MRSMFGNGAGNEGQGQRSNAQAVRGCVEEARASLNQLNIAVAR